MTKIGNTVFEHCEGLTEVKIPDRVTEIGDFAFERNRWLTKVKLPKNLVSLGKYAFAGCSIKRITLPKSLKTIGEGALMNNNLEKIILPDEVERIDKKAFDELQAKFDVASAEVEKLKADAVKAEEAYKADFAEAVKTAIELREIAKEKGVENADGMSNDEIKRAVIAKVYPEVKLDGK